jgi:predicted nucleic acid-binding protein
VRRVFVDSGAFFAHLVPQDASHAAARQAFQQAEEGHKTYSLCDALSFVVMERLGVGEAVAYDRHFREYGRFRMV